MSGIQDPVNQTHLLTLITFVPALGALVILFIPRQLRDLIRSMAVVATGIPVVLAIGLYLEFDRGATTMQFVEQHDWIESLGVEYFVGVDGISVPMVLLTALLGFVCIFASWNIQPGVKGYFSLFLLLETGMMGVFVALDFFLFYVFWEVMLLPMYFLIGIWGGPRKEYAAIKFFLFTLFGSVLMLVAILALYFTLDVPPGGTRSFNMLSMMEQLRHVGILRDTTFRVLLYVAFFIAFAIKVPIFPFHTWLPDAHVEAPTAISVILAGVLLKMGTYAMLRINFPIFPDVAAWTAYGLAVLGVINMVYGAFCAMGQTDLKKLVAYSSISHMGFCLLGMASMTEVGINGAILQMFNHGTITAMLFLLVGVIYDRAHHRTIGDFGGLGTRMPVYSGFTALAFMAALGLPGLSGFISEAMCLLGAFGADRIDLRMLCVIGVLAIVITAAFFLWCYQRMFMGRLEPRYAALPEISGREIFTLAPLGAIVVFLGVMPQPMIKMMSASVNELTKFFLTAPRTL